MEKIKNEMLKSIRYIIPIILLFVGILTLNNFSNIIQFIQSNISTLLGVFTPFFIGFIIAYILNQPMKVLENKFKLKRGLSIALIYGVVVCMIIFAWLFIVPTIESSLNDLYASIPRGINQIENLINSITSQMNLKVDNQNITIQIDEFIKNVLLPLSTNVATVAGDFILNLMSVIVSYTVNIFLGIVISIYLLISKEKSIDITRELSKKILGKYYDSAKEFINILDKNIGVYIVAKLIDSTIYGCLCTAILYLIGSEYALFVGVIIGITNMIPFFGPIIGTIIAVIVNLFFSFDKAIIVLVAMIIAQQLESAILEPYFVGKQVGVPPIFTILAVTLAGKYTGFLGILLSVPITGVLLIYANRFIYKDNNKKIES